MSISWLQTKSSHILHVLSYVSFFLEKIFFAGERHWMLATSVSWQKDVNTLRSVNALSGLYLISTRWWKTDAKVDDWVSMPSRAYTSFLQYYTLDNSRCNISVNALSGLYLISTYLNEEG